MHGGDDDTRRLNQYAQQARWLCIFSYLNATVLHLATSQEKRNPAKGAAPTPTKKVLLETGYKQSSSWPLLVTYNNSSLNTSFPLMAAKRC